MLTYFLSVWYISWPSGIVYGHLVGMFVGYLAYFSRFGILYREKSGNPDCEQEAVTTRRALLPLFIG
jgi:hypothetical protein